MAAKFNESTATTVKSSFTLLIGNAIALIVNAVGIILVGNMLTPAEFGLYTVTLIPSSFFILFSSWGVNQALPRYLAQQTINDQKDSISEFIQTGYIFNFVSSGLLSIILFFSANAISSLILKKPEIADYIRISSLLILSQTIFRTGNAIFAGLEKMNYRASLIVIQSIFKGFLTPLLVYLGYNITGAISGHTISYIVSGLLGVALVLKFYFKTFVNKSTIINRSKLMIKYGLPIFISRILFGISLQIRGVFLSWYSTNELIGNYGVANWFTSLVGIITASIGIALFPTFSKYDIKLESNSTKELYNLSIRYSSLILIPFVCLIISASNQIMMVLFGIKYPHAAIYMSLLIIPNIFIGLGSISNIILLDSQGQTQASLVVNTFGSILSVILSFIFIQYWGIEGLLMGLILARLAKNVLSIKITQRIFQIEPNISHTIKIILSSIIALVATILQQKYISTSNNIIDLILITITYLITFLISAPLIKAITIMDLYNIEKITQDKNIIFRITKIFTNFERKILKVISS